MDLYVFIEFYQFPPQATVQ